MLCSQRGMGKTCPSSTKRSSEVNDKPGRCMEEKWEMRYWNREIRLCEQKLFMDARGRYVMMQKQKGSCNILGESSYAILCTF